MTEDQMTMIQESFAQVAPISKTASELFYNHLFELDPALRPLFKGDMEKQGRLLMATLGFAVANLAKPDALIPAVQQLGERHLTYGVKDAHYDTVGEALLWTLGQGLGDAFPPSLRDAWAECYGTLAAIMKDAAHSAA